MDYNGYDSSYSPAPTQKSNFWKILLILFVLSLIAGLVFVFLKKSASSSPTSLSSSPSSSPAPSPTTTTTTTSTKPSQTSTSTSSSSSSPAPVSSACQIPPPSLTSDSVASLITNYFNETFNFQMKMTGFIRNPYLDTTNSTENKKVYHVIYNYEPTSEKSSIKAGNDYRTFVISYNDTSSVCKWEVIGMGGTGSGILGCNDTKKVLSNEDVKAMITQAFASKYSGFGMSIRHTLVYKTDTDLKKIVHAVFDVNSGSSSESTATAIPIDTPIDGEQDSREFTFNYDSIGCSWSVSIGSKGSGKDALVFRKMCLGKRTDPERHYLFKDGCYAGFTKEYDITGYTRPINNQMVPYSVAWGSGKPSRTKMCSNSTTCGGTGWNYLHTFYAYPQPEIGTKKYCVRTDHHTGTNIDRMYIDKVEKDQECPTIAGWNNQFSFYLPE